MKLEDEIKQQKFRNQKHKLLINLLFTGKWVAATISSYLKPYGLTHQQYNVLRILRGQNGTPISVNGIAERMIDKMSNVSRLIDKLDKKGLVIRKVNRKDRRQADIEISAKGHDLLRRLDNMDSDIENKFHNISMQEAEQLNDLMDKLRG